MGLDMYLNAECYVPAYEHSAVLQKTMFADVLRAVGMPSDHVAEHSPSLTVSVTVGYWRKANQVHGWFVENVQDGVDNCAPHHVNREALARLLSKCKNALQTKEASGLMPTSGFFFGSTDVNEYYWQDLEETVKIVEKALQLPEHWDFIYRSSW